jgi:hypothetical protein
MRALIAFALLTAAPASAQAQEWYGPPPAGGWQAESHRLEIERLRSRAESQELSRQQQRLDTRLRRLELESQRRPAPDLDVRPYRYDTPEAARAGREAATERRERSTGAVSQIDDWLDRSRD